MSYASQPDMIARFGQGEVIALTDRSNMGVIDATVLAGALAEADAEIDPYLQPRYQLPLITVPKVLVGIACDIARYRLCGGPVTVTEDIRTRYNDAAKFLGAVATGKIALGLDALSQAAPAANTVKFAKNTPRVFGRENR
jgi:phage gp36-like protein